MLRELLRFVEPTGTQGGQGGGTYPNLFDAHPPFQIDGNFGGAAAILEMIVQSSPERIHLLPALPDSWPEGELKGVCTRSGHELDITWKAGKVTGLVIRARRAGALEVVEGARGEAFILDAGEELVTEW